MKRHKFVEAKEYVRKMTYQKPWFKGTEIFRENGDTCLHVCAQMNATVMFEYFADRHKADIMALNKAGETPLIVAAREGKLDTVNLIL